MSLAAPNFRDAFITAVKAGNEFVKTTPEGHWYPCGFAWLTAPKVRKNSAEGKAFAAAGFRWDDYRKCFTYSGGNFTNTQSMDYKEAILRVVQQSLESQGLTGFRVETHID